MSTLSHTLSRALSRTLGATTLALGTILPATATTVPPEYTDIAHLSAEEKSTLAQVFRWRDCLRDVRREADARAAILAADRAAAADDVTRRHLQQWGWTAEDSERMVTLLRSSEQNRFSMVFSAKADPENECFKRLNIEQEVIVPALTAISDKYGPDVNSDKTRTLVLPPLKP